MKVFLLAFMALTLVGCGADGDDQSVLDKAKDTAGAAVEATGDAAQGAVDMAGDAAEAAVEGAADVETEVVESAGEAVEAAGEDKAE